MNARERFNAIMNFEQPDRVPFWNLEGICEETVRRWCMQGFPTGRDVSEFVGFDGNGFLPVSTMPIPTYPRRTISSDREWSTYTDDYGFTVRRSKLQAVGPINYYYIDGSVHNRDEWRALTRRYDPADPRRLPLYWSDEYVELCNEGGAPVALNTHWGPGRGPKNGYTLGLERFLEVVMDDPGFVHEIFEFWSDFLIELWRPIVTRLQVDYVVFNEDGLAHKTSSLIGPALYRTVWLPHVKRVIDFLKNHGVGIFSFYTSGNIEPLLPALLETGFNLFGPVEVAAGMDASRLQKLYGKAIRLYGNISRQALMDGPSEVEREVRAKLKVPYRNGGYLPAVDDMIMPDISFESFSRYMALMKSGL